MAGVHPSKPRHGNGRERKMPEIKKPREKQLDLDLSDKPRINPDLIRSFLTKLRINVHGLLHVILEEMPHFNELNNTLRDLEWEEKRTSFSDWQQQHEHNGDVRDLNFALARLRERCQKSRLSQLVFWLMYSKESGPSEFTRLLFANKEKYSEERAKPLLIFLQTLIEYTRLIDKPGKEKEQGLLREIFAEMQKRKLN